MSAPMKVTIEITENGSVDPAGVSKRTTVWFDSESQQVYVEGPLYPGEVSVVAAIVHVVKKWTKASEPPRVFLDDA
jgi:hypothetical protein